MKIKYFSKILLTDANPSELIRWILLAFLGTASVLLLAWMGTSWSLPAAFIIHAAILVSSFMFALKQFSASWGHKVLAIFLLIWADLVFTALILSPFNRLNSLPAYAVLSCSLAIASSLMIRFHLRQRRAGMDQAPLPVQNDTPFRFSPLVTFALSFAIVAILGSLLITLFYYPTNGDSLMYRFPRPYFYVSQGNLYHPAQGIDIRVTNFPLNGPLAYVPNVLYHLNGRSFNWLGFVAWLLCGLGIYLFGRELGASKTGSFLTTCIYLAAPIVLVLATSTNDDIIAAAPLMMGLLFLYRWWHNNEPLEVILGGIGAGLSVGTKLHITFFAPMIVIAAGLLLFKLYKQGRVKRFFQQRLLSLMVAGGLAFLLASPFAFFNMKESGFIYIDPGTSAAATNTPFSIKNDSIDTALHTAELFLSPAPDLVVSGVDFRKQVYGQFNSFFNKTLFFWINPSDDFYQSGSAFRGIADPEGMFSEYTLWLGFAPFIMLVGAAILLANKKSTLTFPTWLLIAFFIWHVTYSAIAKFVYNISDYYSFPITICAAGMALVWDAQTQLRKLTAWLIKSLFIVVIVTNAIFTINILGFNSMRNLTELFESGFSPKIPFVSEKVTDTLQASDKINIVRTHFATLYFDFMRENPSANYSTSAWVPKSDSGILNILPYQTAGLWGNIFIQINEKQRQKKEYLTLLGFTRDPWGTEGIFGKGNNINLTYPNDSGYIVYTGWLEMDRSLVKGDHLCPPYAFPPGGVYPIGFDTEDTKNAEIRVQQITPEGKVLPIRDWESVVRCRYYPLAVPANTGYLNVQLRFKSEPDIISEGFLPLSMYQEYRFLSTPALTTSWLEMYYKLGIYHMPAANFISIDPVLSDTLWLDPTPEYLQIPPSVIHQNQNNKPMLWMGQGKNAGLLGTIWSVQKQTVDFRFKIEPAGSTDNNRRTILFELINADRTQAGQGQFNGATQFVFSGNLTPGPNQFQLSFLDTPADLGPVPDSAHPPLGILRNFNITTQDAPVSNFLPLLPPMQAGPLYAPLVTIDASLAGKVSVSQDIRIPSQWGFEVLGNNSWLWLGHDTSEGVGFTLDSLAAAPQKVSLEFRVLRGPANESNQRTLELTEENAEGTKVDRLQFTEDLYKETTLSYVLDLAPGPNKIDLKVLEEATISLLPQDPRPLLVRLFHITVLPIVK